MPLRDAIAALVSAAPPDATVPVRWLGELLASESEECVSNATTGAIVDLTVKQVAARFGKGASTVRTWIERGDLPDCYLLHNREWRVPLASIEAMQRAQASKHATAACEPPSAARRSSNIGEWRKHLPKAKAS